MGKKGRLLGLQTCCVGHAKLTGGIVTAAQPQTLYDLASLTKPLSTTVLSLLAIRWKLCDLNTPVGWVLDDLAGSPVGAADVGSLLTHTSGLPAWLPLYAICEGDRRLLPQALRDIVPIRPAHVLYSCIGFLVLGMMLERLFGASLAEVFAREVAQPLGVGESIFFLDPGVPAHPDLAGAAERPTAELELIVHDHHPQRGSGRPWLPAGSYPDDGHARWLASGAGNAGLVGTARATARVAAQFLADGGPVLFADEAHMASRRHTAPQDDPRGLGWQLAGNRVCSAGPVLSSRAFGHTGFTGVSTWIEPDRRRFAVLLTNRHHPGHRWIDVDPLRRKFHSLVFSCEP